MLLKTIIQNKKKMPRVPRLKSETMQIYDYMVDFARANGGITPTVRNIMGRFDISSTSVIHYHRKKLVQAGLVALVDGTQSYRLTNAQVVIGDRYKSTAAECFRQDVAKSVYQMPDYTARAIEIVTREATITYNFRTRQRIEIIGTKTSITYWDDSLFVFEVGCFLLGEVTGDPEHEW